jgi:hypothetical protein
LLSSWTADIAVEWMAKVLEIEVELGRFDGKTGLLWVPPNVPMTFWGVDNTGWEPIEEPTPEEKRPSNTLSLGAQLTQLVEAVGEVLDLRAYVMGKKLTISSV